MAGGLPESALKDVTSSSIPSIDANGGLPLSALYGSKAGLAALEPETQPWYKELYNAIAGAPPRISAGALKGIAGSALSFAELKDTETGEMSELGKWIAPKAREQIELASGLQKYADINYPTRSIVGQAASSALVSASQMLPGLLLSIATRTPIGIPMIGMQSYGQEYAEADERGLPIAEKQKSALWQGGTEAATELLPLGMFMKLAKGNKSWALKLGHYLASEVGSEVVATGLQQPMSKVFAKAGGSYSDFPEAFSEWFSSGQWKEDELITVLSTLMMGGMTGSVGTAVGYNRVYNYLKDYKTLVDNKAFDSTDPKALAKAHIYEYALTRFFADKDYEGPAKFKTEFNTLFRQRHGLPPEDITPTPPGTPPPGTPPPSGPSTGGDTAVPASDIVDRYNAEKQKQAADESLKASIEEMPIINLFTMDELHDMVEDGKQNGLSVDQIHTLVTAFLRKTGDLVKIPLDDGKIIKTVTKKLVRDIYGKITVKTPTTTETTTAPPTEVINQNLNDKMEGEEEVQDTITIEDVGDAAARAEEMAQQEQAFYTEPEPKKGITSLDGYVAEFHNGNPDELTYAKASQIMPGLSKGDYAVWKNEARKIYKATQEMIQAAKAEEEEKQSKLSDESLLLQGKKVSLANNIHVIPGFETIERGGKSARIRNYTIVEMQLVNGMMQEIQIDARKFSDPLAAMEAAREWVNKIQQSKITSQELTKAAEDLGIDTSDLKKRRKKKVLEKVYWGNDGLPYASEELANKFGKGVNRVEEPAKTPSEAHVENTIVEVLNTKVEDIPISSTQTAEMETSGYVPPQPIPPAVHKTFWKKLIADMKKLGEHPFRIEVLEKMSRKRNTSIKYAEHYVQDGQEIELHPTMSDSTIRYMFVYDQEGNLVHYDSGTYDTILHSPFVGPGKGAIPPGAKVIILDNDSGYLKFTKVDVYIGVDREGTIPTEKIVKQIEHTQGIDQNLNDKVKEPGLVSATLPDGSDIGYIEFDANLPEPSIEYIKGIFDDNKEGITVTVRRQRGVVSNTKETYSYRIEFWKDNRLVGGDEVKKVFEEKLGTTRFRQQSIAEQTVSLDERFANAVGHERPVTEINKVWYVDPHGVPHDSRQAAENNGGVVREMTQEELDEIIALMKDMGESDLSVKSDAAPIVATNMQLTHLSSNLESITNGFEQRPLGISFARNRSEELSSPRLAEPQGTTGRVYATVSGTGLDYNNKAHKRLIDRIFNSIKDGGKDIGTIAKLRSMGIDFVLNWNGIGKADEVHVINSDAVTIVNTQPINPFKGYAGTEAKDSSYNTDLFGDARESVVPLINPETGEMYEGQMTAEQLREVVMPIVSKIVGGPEHLFFDNMMQLPPAAWAACMSHGTTSGVQAVYYVDKKTGKRIVAWVGGNIRNAEEALKKITHEVVIHYGFRAMFGASADNMLMGMKSFFGEDALKEVAERSGLPYLDRYMPNIIEEALAYYAEDAGKASLYDRVVGRIRNFLRRFMPGLKWNDQEIRSLIHDLNRFVYDPNRMVISETSPEHEPSMLSVVRRVKDGDAIFSSRNQNDIRTYIPLEINVKRLMHNFNHGDKYYLYNFISGEVLSRYPELNNTVVVFEDRRLFDYGEYNSWVDEIVLNTNNDIMLQIETFAHEVQHAIQFIDKVQHGFSISNAFYLLTNGMVRSQLHRYYKFLQKNPYGKVWNGSEEQKELKLLKEFEALDLTELKDITSILIKEIQKNNNQVPTNSKAYNDALGILSDKFNQYYDLAYRIYTLVSGEVEARESAEADLLNTVYVEPAGLTQIPMPEYSIIHPDWYFLPQEVDQIVINISSQSVDNLDGLTEKQRKQKRAFEVLRKADEVARARGTSLEEVLKENGLNSSQIENLLDAASTLYTKYKNKVRKVRVSTIQNHILEMCKTLQISARKLETIVAMMTGITSSEDYKTLLNNLNVDQLKDVFNALNLQYKEQFGKKYSARRKKPKSNIEKLTFTNSKDAIEYAYHKFVTSGETYLRAYGPAGAAISEAINRIHTKVSIDTARLTQVLNANKDYIAEHNDRLLHLYLGDEAFYAGLFDEEIREYQNKQWKNIDPALDRIIVNALQTTYATMAGMMEDRYMTVQGNYIGPEGKKRFGYELFRWDGNNWFPHIFNWEDIQGGSKRKKLLQSMIRNGYAKNEEQADLYLLRIFKNRTSPRRYGNMEYLREFNVPGWERDILSSTSQYVYRGLNRLYSIDEFGKKGLTSERTSNMLEAFMKAGGDPYFATEIIQRVIGQAPLVEAKFKRFADIVLTFEVITKMGFSGLTNITQTVNVLGTTNLSTYVKTFWQFIKSSQSREESLQFAYLTGAGLGTVLKEFIDFTKGQVVADQFLRKVGFTQAELFNRTFAAVAGRIYVMSVFNKFKKAPVGSSAYKRYARELQYLKLNPETLHAQTALTQNDLLAAGLAMSDRTQFRSGPLDLPEFMNHSPAVRMLTLFQSFAYHQAKFIKDLALRNPLKFLLWILAAFMLGKPLTMFKKWLRGQEQVEWGDTPSEHVKYIVDGVSSAAGFGLAFDIVGSLLGSPEGAIKSIAGPVISDAATYSTAVMKGLMSPFSDKEWIEDFTPLARGLIDTSPYFAAKLSPIAAMLAAFSKGQVKSYMFPTENSIYQ